LIRLHRACGLWRGRAADAARPSADGDRGFRRRLEQPPCWSRLGQGNHDQGGPWESFFGGIGRFLTRQKSNTTAFDYFDESAAEALFRIAHTVNGAANDPEFDAFFAKAVGNYLMGLAFRWTPSAQDEREKERWLDEKPQGFDAFVAAMFAGGGEFDMRNADDVDEARARAQNEADARDMATASEIDAGETQWLLAHLSRAGALTSAEKALLEFLRQEAPSLPEALRGRMGEAA
jgi:hypothetical protein